MGGRFRSESPADLPRNQWPISVGIRSLHRLQTASGVWGTYSYVYDPLNNLRSRSGASSLSYNYNASSNRLSSVSGATTRSYSYNASGDVTGDGSKSYSLNAKGQITAITGVANYGYDAHGKRIKSTTTADGRIEYALYSLSGQLRFTAQAQAATTAPACLSLNCLLTNVGDLLNRLLGLSSVSIASTTDYLHLQGKPLAEIKLSGSTTTVTYLHPDLLGSPRMATNSSGQTLWQEHYDPYGKKLNNVAEKLGYTGHAYDQESGLTYAQARFYDAQVGRFLSTDPIHFTGNPFTFNRYSYANNNPYTYADPTGMEVEPNTCSRVGGESCSGSYSVGEQLKPLEQALSGVVNQAKQAVQQAVDYAKDNPGTVAANVLDAGMLVFGVLQPQAGLGRMAAKEAAEALAARRTTTVIGKVADLKNLAAGEQSLLSRLPNLGSPKANWAQNSGVLRQEMGLGRPIRDATVDSSGQLINNTGFLRAERNLLETHGWTYDSATTMWYSPVGP